MNLPSLIGTFIATRSVGRPVVLSDAAYERRKRHLDDMIAMHYAAIFAMVVVPLLIGLASVFGWLDPSPGAAPQPAQKSAVARP